MQLPPCSPKPCSTDRYPVGPSSYSVVVADFNGDGRPDIATASHSSATVSVLLRNSDGTFQPGVSYAAGNSPNSLRPLYVADVNNDGKPDLLVLNTTDQTLSVQLGNGDGTCQTQKVITIAGSYCCLAVGDFNGDGKVDIATPVLGAVVGTYGFAVLLGKGDGTFQAPVGYPSGELFALTAADLTNNGKLDLVTDSSVMLGKGDGTFQAPIKTPLPTVSGLSILIADFNHDGNLDVATSHGNFLALMLGNGDGTFREQVLTVPATPLAVGDLQWTVHIFAADHMAHRVDASSGSVGLALRWHAAASSLPAADRFGFPYAWLRRRQFIVHAAAIHRVDGNTGRHVYGFDHCDFRKLEPPSHADRHCPVGSTSFRNLLTTRHAND